MKRFKTILLFINSALLFVIIKELLVNVSYESEVLNIILTISSLLFGLLAGFFMSGLWGRYTTIRSLQAEWSAGILALINYANLIGTKEFKKNFFSFLKKYLYLVVLNDWQSIEKEIKYFNKGILLLKPLIRKKLTYDKYISSFVSTYNEVINKLATLNILGKERLSSSEWFILYLLSSMIFLTSVFIRSDNLIFLLFSYLFPFTVILILILLNSLNTLSSSVGIITYEPTEECFDALGTPRFYLKDDVKYKPIWVKNYVTEDDIKDEIKSLDKELKEMGLRISGII